MKKLFWCLFLIGAVACGLVQSDPEINKTDVQSSNFSTTQVDTSRPMPVAHLDTADVSSEPFLDCFIVIADTSMEYAILREQMLLLNQQLLVPIDTLGRTYDALEGSIVSADTTDSEEDNAYFPRRFPDASLSLEYLSAYAPHSNGKTIALVTGIYGEKKDAAAALQKLKAKSKKAFMIPATVYLGCTR